MATTKANVRQTAMNVAASVIGAATQAGLISSLDEATAKFEEFQNKVYGALVEELSDADKPQRGGGGQRSGGGSSITAESARGTVLKYGKFKDKTLGEVEAMTSEETAKFGYDTGNGLKYLEWLAGDKNDNDFLQRRAKAILEDRRASSDAA